jgi:hypothetical protein
MATTSQFTIDGNTKALYHVDGTAGSADKKDNAEGTASRDITEHSSPGSATGYIVPTTNGAYVVSNGANYLTFTPNMGSSAFTIEGWVKFPNVSPWTAIEVLLSAYPSSNYVFIGSWSASEWYFEISFTDGLRKFSFPEPPDTNWHYFAMTYDASGTNSVKVYWDAVLQTLTNLGFANNDSTGTVGDNLFAFFNHNDGTYPTSITQNWYIDEWRFSNVARTATEIYNYYNDVGATTMGLELGNLA